MKLHWFSPLPPARTDIANYTARVLPALAQTVDSLTLWSPASKTAPAVELPANATLRIFRSADELPWPELNRADAVVYQIGNNTRFHGLIAAVAQRHPGVVVLHDYSIHELFRAFFLEPPGSLRSYLRALRHWSGPEAEQAGKAQLAEAGDLQALATAYPMASWLTREAEGVIVHNPAIIDALRAETLAPVKCLPLAYLPRAQLPSTSLPQREPGAPARMLFFGFIHSANRRLMPILDALAAHPQKAHLELTLAGEYDRPAVEAALRERQLTAQVRLLGYLGEAELARELERTELVLNLRYPSRGESSGTLLRVWSHARPCLVTRTGYYATLPEATVGWVEPERESADLARHFSALLEHPTRYQQIGQAGRTELEQRHTAEAYVQALLPALEGERSSNAAAMMARRLATEVLPALPPEPLQPLAVQRLSRELAAIWPPAKPATGAATQ